MTNVLAEISWEILQSILGIKFSDSPALNAHLHMLPLKKNKKEEKSNETMVSLHHAWSKILFLRFFTSVLPSMMKKTDYARCKHKGWGKASKYQTTDNSH